MVRMVEKGIWVAINDDDGDNVLDDSVYGYFGSDMWCVGGELYLIVYTVIVVAIHPVHVFVQGVNHGYWCPHYDPA